MIKIIKKNYLFLIPTFVFIILLIKQVSFLIQIPIFNGIEYPHIELDNVIYQIGLIAFILLFVYYIPTRLTIEIVTFKWNVVSWPTRNVLLSTYKLDYIVRKQFTHKSLCIYRC